MNLFDKLTKSKFLSNINVELARAAKVVQTDSKHVVYKPTTHNFSSEESKALYHEICYSYDFLSLLYEIPPTNKQLHYIQADQFIFIASRSKQNMTQALHYSLQVNGDLPLYRTKHVISNKSIHTMLIDTTFTINPPTYN